MFIFALFYFYFLIMLVYDVAKCGYIVFERELVDISFMLIIVSALSGTDITHLC
jgi:hypothetical protein